MSRGYLRFAASGLIRGPIPPSVRPLSTVWHAWVLALPPYRRCAFVDLQLIRRNLQIAYALACRMVRRIGDGCRSAGDSRSRRCLWRRSGHIDGAYIGIRGDVVFGEIVVYDPAQPLSSSGYLEAFIDAFDH